MLHIGPRDGESPAHGKGSEARPLFFGLEQAVSKTVVERNSRTIIRRLESEGWVLEKSEGSHHKFRHPHRDNSIIVPHPKKELPTDTARSIARSAGWLDETE
ncbi:MAG: type II toxin-antitoxin system HicA family toxin [Hyphomicrobiaceae bacterium]